MYVLLMYRLWKILFHMSIPETFVMTLVLWCWISFIMNFKPCCTFRSNRFYVYFSDVSVYFLRMEAATALVHLSHRNSVRLSVTRVDQSKTVQARITKSLPSAAWKTLLSGTVKLFYKFEGGHPKRRC